MPAQIASINIQSFRHSYPPYEVNVVNRKIVCHAQHTARPMGGGSAFPLVSG
jgi:hypothetical protein